MTIDDVRRLLKDACAKAGGQKHWARNVGLSAQFVGDVIMGKRAPGPRMLHGLGLTATVVYRKAKREPDV